MRLAGAEAKIYSCWYKVSRVWIRRLAFFLFGCSGSWSWLSCAQWYFTPKRLKIQTVSQQPWAAWSQAEILPLYLDLYTFGDFPLWRGISCFSTCYMLIKLWIDFFALNFQQFCSFKDHLSFSLLLPLPPESPGHDEMALGTTQAERCSVEVCACFVAFLCFHLTLNYPCKKRIKMIWAFFIFLFFLLKVSLPALHITTLGLGGFFAGIISLRTKLMGHIGLRIAERQHALKIILAHTWGQLCFSVIQASSSLN